MIRYSRLSRPDPDGTRMSLEQPCAEQAILRRGSQASAKKLEENDMNEATRVGRSQRQATGFMLGIVDPGDRFRSQEISFLRWMR